MKKLYCLVLVLTILISGCGIEWFPEDKSSTGGTASGAPTLSKSYKPVAILSGTNSTLTFTINNGQGNLAQSGLGFVDQLDPSLTVTLNQSQCGGTASFLNSKIIFIGGQLAAGATNCTITAIVTGTIPGNYTNRAIDISSLVGGLLNSSSDQTLQVLPASITDSTNVVTASNLTANGNQNPTTVSYDFFADIINSAAGSVNVSVVVQAIDLNGALIDSTFTTIPAVSVPSGTSNQLPLSSTPTVVPLDVAANIQFWAIFIVTVIQ